MKTEQSKDKFVKQNQAWKYYLSELVELGCPEEIMEYISDCIKYRSNCDTGQFSYNTDCARIYIQWEFEGVNFQRCYIDRFTGYIDFINFIVLLTAPELV